MEIVEVFFLCNTMLLTWSQLISTNDKILLTCFYNYTQSN